MKHYWNEKTSHITPYICGEQPKEKLIKLNTNENPYPPSLQVNKVIQALDVSSLRRYPSPGADTFRNAAATINEVDPSQIFCGNGSDEVLATAFQAFFDHDLRFFDVTYSFYPVWANLYQINYEILPINEDYTFDISLLFGAKDVILPNPNAPTGIALSLKEIEAILTHISGVLVLDEAYTGFGAESALPLLKTYDNLLIIRTLSKTHALAGMRAGYAIGSPHLIEGMERIKDSFNSYPVNTVTNLVVAASLLDTEYTAHTASLIIKEREALSKALSELGFLVLPSKSNFLFARPPMDSTLFFQKLRDRGILVRHFNGPKTNDWLRITVGTPEEMAMLINATKEILAQ